MNGEIMTEEVLTEGNASENEEVSPIGAGGDDANDEDTGISREEELEEALAAARSENEYLKAKCICAEIGIPTAMTEDIICLGRFYAEKNGVDFEEAARAAYARISAGGRGITTGVRGERLSDDGSALRRAFGLKG